MTGAAPGRPCVPRQYLSFGGPQPMFCWALRRALGLVPPARVIAVVAERHRPLWHSGLPELPPENVIVQPRDRGTGPEALLPLLDVFLRRDRAAQLLFLAADHYVGVEHVLRSALLAAARAAQGPGRPLVLLGMTAGASDAGLGWILPSPGMRGALRGVSAFLERPDGERARELTFLGALVNSSMLVAQAARLLDLYEATLPRLVSSLVPAVMGGSHPERLWAAYEQIPPSDVWKHVLQRCLGPLAVLRVPACGWSDLGTPERVQRFLGRHRRGWRGKPLVAPSARGVA